MTEELDVELELWRAFVIVDAAELEVDDSAVVSPHRLDLFRILTRMRVSPTASLYGGRLRNDVR